MKEPMGMDLLLLFYLTLLSTIASSVANSSPQIIELKGGPEDVTWIVQLSDLHFSVHHPERATDFKDSVGPILSMVNPSLVLVTGDLTDGKSKDLLTMKQNEREWLEYTSVMEDVVTRSGLDRTIFYDLRGNHDNFDVPSVGGSSDFFSRYSLNGQLKRSKPVNSITIETGKRKILFVGFDSTMSSGLRGPTNLFGHPTDSLLDEISSELSQWDSQNENLITKISFGHFPLSFTAPSSSGRTLRDTFLAHSLSAYLCGHLHARFGKNLKRHHGPSNGRLVQLDAHYLPKTPVNCSTAAKTVEGFWELEMGDWRKSRAMRILAIDKGRMSFLDMDLKLGGKETIILPTFPLDSRFTSSMSVYDCASVDQDLSTYGTIRALVFSTPQIVEVVAKVSDSRPGKLHVVFEAPMTKSGNALSRVDLYSAQWNFKAFEDPSPERFWLQIEATDEMGRTSLTEPRPFSINGIHAKLPWNWKEVFVMGCQWANLYYPILWSFYLAAFSVLLVPKALLFKTTMQYTYKNFKRNRSFSNFVAWVLTSVYQVPLLWFFMVGYLCYLIFCPWLVGQIFTDGDEWAFMNYKGWLFKSDQKNEVEFLGFPDIMVIVLPHLLFIVLPSVVVIHALAAERDINQEYLLSSSGKKEDDIITNEESGDITNVMLKFGLQRRLIRYFILLFSLLICWKHFKNCRALMKAYEMNPVMHFPIYSLVIPLMLSYTLYKTRGADKVFKGHMPLWHPSS